MKKILLIYLVLLNFGCKSIKSQNIPLNTCSIINVILDQKDINRLTGISVAKNVQPSIRIFDLSGKFNKCQSLYRSKNLEFSIPYHVENYIRPSINTGIFRDIVIHKFRYDRDKNKGEIVLSIATFQTHNNVNTNFRIVLNFEVVNSKTINFIDTKITDYIDPPPNLDYEKY